MPPVAIETPILNSPFDEPTRHFKFDDEGITNDRVSGPFTVESLSPHRVLAADEQLPAAEREGRRDTAVQFEQMILDNLRKAGVQRC